MQFAAPEERSRRTAQPGPPWVPQRVILDTRHADLGSRRARERPQTSRRCGPLEDSTARTDSARAALRARACGTKGRRMVKSYYAGRSSCCGGRARRCAPRPNFSRSAVLTPHAPASRRSRPARDGLPHSPALTVRCSGTISLPVVEFPEARGSISPRHKFYSVSPAPGWFGHAAGTSSRTTVSWSPKMRGYNPDTKN